MPTWVWLVFTVLVGLLVALDLRVFTRRPVTIGPREAATGFAMWFVAAIGVGLCLSLVYRGQDLGMGLREALSHPIDGSPIDGTAAFLQFCTAYVVELVLSIDNLAILALLMAAFEIPAAYGARAVLWAMLGSLLVRLGLIQAGAAGLEHVPWMPEAFGGLLAAALLRTLVMHDSQADVSRSLLVRAVRRWVPLSASCASQSLWDVQGPVRRLSPIGGFAVAWIVADATFALDSVPAAFAVTKDAFIAFSANAMAILALRPLAALLAGIGGRLRYGKVGIALLLVWIAAKMFLEDYRKSETAVTLAIALGLIGLTVGASLLYERGRARLVQATVGRPSAAADMGEALAASRRNLRKIAVLIVGTLVVLVGVVIIGPLPGPGGIPIVLGGLALLATEFIWAQRALERMRTQARSMQQATNRMAERTNPWMVPLVFGVFWGGVWLASHLLYEHQWRKAGTLVWISAAGIFLPIGYWGFGSLRAAWRARRNSPPPAGPARP